MCFETYLNIASIIRLKKLQEVQAGEEKLCVCVGGGIPVRLNSVELMRVILGKLRTLFA